MGLCSSSIDEDDRVAYEASKAIDKENAKDYQSSTKLIKLLLLGAGESGKSTVFKQMRLLYGEEYSEEETMSFKLFIHHNVVETMEQMCLAAKELKPDDPLIQSDDFKLVEPEVSLTIDQFRKFPDMNERYVSALKTLWNSDLIKYAWSQRAQFQVSDTAAVFLDRIDEISARNYKPSAHDIILARIRTTGIREERLKIDGQIFQFFDVGGQRNERRKWINCFDGVHGVIFMASLSDFDQKLYEDNSANRMLEALDLFEQTCGEDAFTRSALILFLNKSDLFEEKIKHVNIADVPEFSDYTATPYSKEEGLHYFLNKFLARNHSNREVFHHVTNATDTSSIKVVFNACKSIIIQRSLEDIGFLS